MHWRRDPESMQQFRVSLLWVLGVTQRDQKALKSSSSKERQKLGRLEGMAGQHQREVLGTRHTAGRKEIVACMVWHGIMVQVADHKGVV